MDRIDPNKIKEKEWMDMDNKFEQWKELDPDEPNVSDTPNVPNIPWEPEVSWFSAPGDGPWSNPESGH
jgi:hypothetical protein